MSAFLDNLLGALLIGVILSSIIYGITWLQVYLYYTQYSSKDTIFLKGFVAVLTLITLGFSLSWAVRSFRHKLWKHCGRSSCPMAIVAQCIIGVAVTTCIQQFYAVRIFLLSERKNIHIPLAICIISVAELALGVAFAIKSLQNGAFAKNAPSVPFGASGLALEVICGALITASMVYYILRQRSSIERSNRVLNLVILYIINSGALNLIFAATCLITYVKYPKTLIYAPFFFILVRLYPCSFMTILNSRVHLRSRLRAPEGRTRITVAREEVTDDSPLTTSKLATDSNDETLALVSGIKAKPTAEKAVGLDETIIFEDESRSHPQSRQEPTY